MPVDEDQLLRLREAPPEIPVARQLQLSIDSAYPIPQSFTPKRAFLLEVGPVAAVGRVAICQIPTMATKISSDRSPARKPSEFLGAVTVSEAD